MTGGVDHWRQTAEPVLARLSTRWAREDDIARGLRFPNILMFAAVESGLAERRKRWFRRGWWMRLARARPQPEPEVLASRSRVA